MALVLDFTICENSTCDGFTFKDITGIYNVTTNPTGWGAPNDTLADVTTPVTLDITLPNGTTTYSIDLTTTSPTFPVNQAPDELEVDMSSMGGSAGDKIPDGIYTFVYTVTTTNATYTQTVTAAFYCQVNCCVLSMFKDLNVDCDCCDEDRNNLMSAYLLLQGLKYAANCGNISEFNSILAALQKKCTQSNCSNCR